MSYYFRSQKEADTASRDYLARHKMSSTVVPARKRPGMFMVAIGGRPIWFNSDDRDGIYLRGEGRGDDGKFRRRGKLHGKRHYN